MKIQIDLKSKVKSVITLGVSLLLLIIFGYQCPLLEYTGIACPVCGMTRAWLSILRFDIPGAFHYHPLFLLVPFISAVMLFPEFTTEKTRKYIYIIVGIIFVLVYFYRLFFTASDVVTIDFWNSPAGQIIDILKNAF
jgi:hypothetical protein